MYARHRSVRIFDDPAESISDIARFGFKEVAMSYAVITGGAKGIGLAIGDVWLRRGGTSPSLVGTNRRCLLRSRR